ncbi:alanine racemase [Planococcus sp. CP5-4]|uniref:alanine racemase n=1 Tax=unclassified Planococcus (in: firmicutes) TaxID=2662419 RepID=UPI001C23165C|nr:MULTISPECIES: alanine racemase [unclassified Planococcus (in: firmicutes)]MBU9672278.1 alanine racemase [Planococcus sp. CP5-4_YE]MBV0909329.1 alanine racemase [Planococcus sp. CP5-4_UN]MBW6064058.1 alanine racemase [Planococcus sp. CP5-4]
MEMYRPTKAVINLQAIRNNLAAFQKRAGDAEVIAVVKADGYGHGAEEIARTAVECGIRMLAVATPDEALLLRRAEIEQDILVMGAVPAAFVPVAQRENIIVTALSLEWIEAAEKAAASGQRLRVHLKVDSGMGRIGIQPGEAETAFAKLASEKFSFEGIFTHFAAADDEDPTLFERQVDRMNGVLEQLPKRVMVHVSNSAAALMHPFVASDAVRIGISLYGIAPSPYVGEHSPVTLEPALSLETQIVHIKKVQPGATISYGATYRSEGEEWIATLPIGYADGMLRGLQGQEVLVRGERAPVVGRICMDQCMIRLSEELPVGEPVQLIGRQGDGEVLIDEWAEKLGTIPYEIPCILTKRVPRVYANGTKNTGLPFQSNDSMVR